MLCAKVLFGAFDLDFLETGRRVALSTAAVPAFDCDLVFFHDAIPFCLGSFVMWFVLRTFVFGR